MSVDAWPASARIVDGLKQLCLRSQPKNGFRRHPTTVAKLELDERVLSAQELGVYASLFGCSTDSLLGRATKQKADYDFALLLSGHMTLGLMRQRRYGYCRVT